MKHNYKMVWFNIFTIIFIAIMLIIAGYNINNKPINTEKVVKDLVIKKLTNHISEVDSICKIKDTNILLLAYNIRSLEIIINNIVTNDYNGQIDTTIDYETQLIIDNWYNIKQSNYNILLSLDSIINPKGYYQINQY